jgi:hypothetical protein
VLPEPFATAVTADRLRPARLLADLPPPEHEPGRARDAADRVLARPEYRWADDESLFERIGGWVAEQIERVAAPLGLGVGGVPVWVGWLVLVALVALVGVLVYRSRAGWRRDRVPGAAGVGRVVVSAGDDRVDWAAEVDRCESLGLWRDALRARFRVLVGELAQRGVIGDLVGRTAGELVTDVRATAPGAAPAFAAATELFEAAWYGGAPSGPDERDRFVRLADDVRAAARRDWDGVEPSRAVRP